MIVLNLSNTTQLWLQIFEGELKNSTRCLSDSQHKHEEKCSFIIIPLSIERTSEVVFSVVSGVFLFVESLANIILLNEIGMLF